ncbi:MAG: Lrp/AsnC family transcriptional regulator [Alphaproteobacteria bacterium]|nr:Lrp/AsnC family transcriptional regulator [Alphaproteobacteria bacterium]NCQ67137.1 Lrp/AsnC family transcriptional regulator [Alphaproteobacteria bacterium]NCT07733.1 Lrp/AsnC family transcriptional regulator [Alphaproteobacteria bacterium]
MARLNSEVSSELPKAVAEIGKISITGNIVPPLWFKTITFESGKPDTNSILILSDILYWYRPTELRNEHTGFVIGYRKKFQEDLLRRSYADFEVQFGLSKKQCQECLRRLENLGVIKRIFRTLHSRAGRLNNVMYIDLVPSVVQRLTTMTHETPVFSKEAAPMEDEIPPYGDQAPQVWNSNSIGDDVERPPYGDQAPHHIKDTNTTSNISSLSSSKDDSEVPSQAELKNEGGEESLSGKMLSIWNKLVSEKSITTANKFLSKQLEAALHDQLEGDLQNWETVCNNFKSSKFLMGEADKVAFKPNLSWLVSPKEPRVANVFSKSQWTFDDRESFGKSSLDFDEIESSIESINEPEICKKVRHFVFKRNPGFYHGYIRQAEIEVKGSCLYIIHPNGFCRDKIEQDFGMTLRDFLKENSSMKLEIKGPNK